MLIGHGGNKKELAKKLSCPVDDIIDMSCNLNPLGPPRVIDRVICDNLEKIRTLPEPDAMGMRKGFAAFHGIDENEVVAGNGTTWFIYTLPIALGSKKVLIAGPTYSDYRDACSMHGIAFEHFHSNSSRHFMPDIDGLSRMAENADTVFLCNPNNPTGALLTRDKLAFLLKTHEDTVFVIDESYLPFVEDANEFSLVSATHYKNLMVLSSMSKIFRIPGLRTGFISGDKHLAAKVMGFYQPWSVNALAQTVIEHVFDHPHEIEPFYEKTRGYIKAEKKVFLESLADVPGIHFFDSAAYFILARLTDQMDSKTFCERIGREKILIRDCSNFLGLSDRYVRFSLKERQTNLRLAGLIKKALRE